LDHGDSDTKLVPPKAIVNAPGAIFKPTTFHAEFKGNWGPIFEASGAEIGADDAVVKGGSDFIVGEDNEIDFGSIDWTPGPGGET
jgi:hypothetical protein